MNCASLHRRIALLLGTPRSGSTWLGTILSTCSSVLYRHEPIGKYFVHAAPEKLDLLKAGEKLPDAIRVPLLDELSVAHHETARPPFFAKPFLARSHRLQWAAWLLARRSNAARNAYRNFFSPNSSAAYDLVVKEVGWARHAESFVRALNAVPIIIVRHPCAVVSSQLVGMRSGWMINPQNTAEWWTSHSMECKELGLAMEDVNRLQSAEFLALKWTVANRLYFALASRYESAIIVSYEALCRSPIEMVSSIFHKLGWQLDEMTRKFLARSTTKETGRLPAWLLGKRRYFNIYKNAIHSSEKWRTQLDDSTIESILRIVSTYGKDIAFRTVDAEWTSPTPSVPGTRS